jgi:hypothetical protein
MPELKTETIKRELRAYYAYLQYLTVNSERGVGVAPDGTNIANEICIVRETISKKKKLIKN